MSPDIVNKMTKEAGFEIIQSSLDIDQTIKEGNLYYSRDLLFVMRLA